MLERARGFFEDMVRWRRDFHMHPEIGFEVHRTAGIVAEQLEKLGYRVRRGVGKTGVVADLGEQEGPTIGIRADMDALPIQESDDREHASLVPGAMHACGHDGHTAMALGAAALLARASFRGRVRFLFQPSEEKSDEQGMGGAQRMVEDGAVDGLDMVIAQHVDAHTPVGQVLISPGVNGGGVSSWYASLRGVGGHGAHPERAIDPFMLLAQVINSLNAVVSRRLDPFEPAVISIGQVHGGFTENVIPERVELAGTIRFTSEAARLKIEAEMRRAFEVAHTLGGEAELRFEFGSPPLINHETAARLIRQSAVAMLGEDKVLPNVPSLGAEDFGYMIENIPGAMFGLGVRMEGNERTIHHPRFDLDERALPIGAAILAETALRFLGRTEDGRPETGLDTEV